MWVRGFAGTQQAGRLPAGALAALRRFVCVRGALAAPCLLGDTLAVLHWPAGSQVWPPLREGGSGGKVHFWGGETLTTHVA